MDGLIIEYWRLGGGVGILMAPSILPVLVSSPSNALIRWVPTKGTDGVRSYGFSVGANEMMG